MNFIHLDGLRVMHRKYPNLVSNQIEITSDPNHMAR